MRQGDVIDEAKTGSGWQRWHLDWLKQAARSVLLPVLPRPRQLQTAALCFRQTDNGKEVLLVTSRGTGRWIIPKGWPMRGMNASQAAAVEAWEEAGVRPAHRSETPIGSYTYKKVKASGLPVDVEALVYPIEVKSLASGFPEAHERKRRWVAPAKAAEMVDEPGLRALLQRFTA